MRGVRSALLALFGLSAAACGGGGSPMGDDDDDVAGGPDAAAADTPDGGSVNPANGFSIQTPDIEIGPLDERTYCYYTTLDVAETAGVKKWSSQMTPGSHHLIMFFTTNAQQPDGTLVENCGFGSIAADPPVWSYSSQTPTNEATLPAGIGMTVNAHQHVFIQMHYLNTTEETLTAHVAVQGETYAPGEEYTPAAAYVTYNTEIEVQPGEMGEANGSCAVPAGAKFIALSTHSHRFSIATSVADGSNMILESDNWEHPPVMRWNDDPFLQFQSTLNYHCEYYNGTDTVVHTGDSAKTDEMCMAVGYFFPASKPVFCINSFVVPF